MKNVHILSTDKPSRLYLEYGDGKICFCRNLLPQTARSNNQNIYITSDEDIDENDYIITKDGRLVQVSYLLSKDLEGASKVILTTDQELIKDGVQAIDDEFLEWFVKNPSCEWIEVNDWLDDKGNIAFNGKLRYQIIIPKEEPKQEMKNIHTLLTDKEIEDYYIGKTLKLKRVVSSRYYDGPALQKSETIKVDKFIDCKVEGCRAAVGYKNGFEYLLFNTTHIDSYIPDAFEVIDEIIIPAEEPKQETFIEPDTIDGEWLSPIATERQWQEEKLVEIFEHYPNASPKWQYMNGLIQNSLDAKKMYSEDQVKKAIIELESKLKKLRVADVSVSDCISKNEVLHYMDIDTVGACSKCGSMKQYEH